MRQEKAEEHCRRLGRTPSARFAQTTSRYAACPYLHSDFVCTMLIMQSASGQYTLLSLVIDVPGSSAAQPNRAVVFWSPEADTEGVAVRRR